MYSLRLLTAYGLIKFKERMVALLCVQYLGDTAGAERGWSDLLRIAITPMASGTDFHVHVISSLTTTETIRFSIPQSPFPVVRTGVSACF